MRVIIDGNAMGWAHHSATKLNYAGLQTQAIYGYARMMRDFFNAFPGAPISVLWDGHAQHRFDILPTYKASREANREKDPQAASDHAEYKRAIPVIRAMLELMGVPQLLHPRYEADDLAGLMVNKFPGPHMLVTGDSDWLQLVRNDVVWFDPRKDGKKIALANFHEATGYATPEEYLNGKVLIGDTSDDIPGVPGMGEVGAAAFIAKWRTIQSFLDAVDQGTAVPTKRKSKTAKTPHPEEFIVSPEGRAIIHRGFELMDLRTPRIGNPELLQVRRGQLDEEKLKVLFQRLGFVSILRDWNSWFAPFTNKALATA